MASELESLDQPRQPEAGPPQADRDKGGRRMVRTGNVNPVDVADDVVGELLGSNDPPRLFSMGPQSAVFLEDDGALRPLDADRWLYHVARRVTFWIATKDPDHPIIVAPPVAAMKLIPPAILPELPPLDGVAAVPYFDREGTLVSAEGYHPGTRRFLRPSGLDIPDVPEGPAEEDLARARHLLMVEWLGDFPFAGPADKANALAVLLTLTGRMFFDLAPLFVFDASTAGSGKGLLVATISLIATGEPPKVMELPADGEEQRKKITSAVLDGQELIMWDESHTISGRSLAAILTAEKYSDRLLGGNRMITVTNRFTQVALGNNVEVRGDMQRRVVPSRLVPDTEHPEHRTDFRHQDLEHWVREHRGELLWAVLVIWRNWVALDRPEAGTVMGSFERWARTVGGALAAAGIDGFRSNTAEWLSQSEDDDGWGAHLADLRARFGDRWFDVADVVTAVEAAYQPIKRPPVRHEKDKTLGQQLGYHYRRIRQKLYGDLRLIRSETKDSASGGRTWSVAVRPGAASGWSGSPGSSGMARNRRSEPRQATDDGSLATDHRGHGQDDSLTMEDGQDGQERRSEPRADHPDHPDHLCTAPAGAVDPLWAVTPGHAGNLPWDELARRADYGPYPGHG